jgi:hypothetical protein
MMKSFKLSHRASLLCAIAGLVAAALPASADVVETVNGSTIRGKVIASDDGTIKVETDFAGVVSIKQDQVKSVSTDDPINVALKDGTTTKGALDTSGSTLRVNTPTGVLSTQTAAVTAVWRDGDKSPADKALDALRRKWTYQVGFDLNGKKGNTDRMFLGTDFMAVLKSPADRLAFYGRYARGEEEDTVTQDEAKGGVDYTNYFSERVSWYVRTELGFDRTKDLDLRSQTAAGLGYSFFKRSNWTMEGRAGLNYRFESYAPPLEDFDSAGLDFGFINRYDFSWGKMTNLVTLTPSFDDFANYVLLHESAIEMPIGTAKFWKLRFGIRNDYTSEPPNPALKSHDWSYFTQLILNWE